MLRSIPNSPSPSPLPPGERVSQLPSLDGRGKGEGDKRLLSQRLIAYLNAYPTRSGRSYIPAFSDAPKGSGELLTTDRKSGTRT
jgi:hypothetical protein